MRILFLVLCVITFGFTPSEAFQPAAGGGSQKAEQLYRQAMNAYGSAGYQKAVELTTEAIKADPKHAKAYTLRGKATMGLGDMEAGTKDLDMAIKLDPTIGEAYFLRAQMSEIMGDMEGAEKDYKKACANKYSQACK